MTREKAGDGAMQGDFDFQDFPKVPFPITEPSSSKFEHNLSKFSQYDHSDSMSVDLGESEVFYQIFNFL